MTDQPIVTVFTDGLGWQDFASFRERAKTQYVLCALEKAESRHRAAQLLEVGDPARKAECRSREAKWHPGCGACPASAANRWMGWRARQVCCPAAGKAVSHHLLPLVTPDCAA